MGTATPGVTLTGTSRTSGASVATIALFRSRRLLYSQYWKIANPTPALTANSFRDIPLFSTCARQLPAPRIEPCAHLCDLDLPPKADPPTLRSSRSAWPHSNQLTLQRRHELCCVFNGQLLVRG